MKLNENNSFDSPIEKTQSLKQFNILYFTIQSLKLRQLFIARL